MGQTFSTEPIVDKETEREKNDTFNVAVSTCQGWRVTQEDNHSLILNLPGEHKAAFFAVYDGHGSAQVSKHASEGLWRHLVENKLYSEGKFKEALVGAFLSFDREVIETYKNHLGGTTAVCLLIVNNTIYCANIGDSRAVASVNCQCVPLSFDHKPDNPNECHRILAAGGWIQGNRVNGNLNLSRAFGDYHYKANETLAVERQMVIPYPDVEIAELNDDVDFLLLACDGIWDVLSNEEVVDFVIAHIEQSMEPGKICEELITRCTASNYELVIGCDNMTVLLVCYTRGRSWDEYCTDIFTKNTERLGVHRERILYNNNGEGSRASIEKSLVDLHLGSEVDKDKSLLVLESLLSRSRNVDSIDKKEQEVQNDSSSEVSGSIEECYQKSEPTTNQNEVNEEQEELQDQKCSIRNNQDQTASDESLEIREVTSELDQEEKKSDEICKIRETETGAEVNTSKEQEEVLEIELNTEGIEDES